MCSCSMHATLVENNNLVCLHNRSNTLSNNDFGNLAQAFEILTYTRIGCHIQRTG